MLDRHGKSAILCSLRADEIGSGNRDAPVS
jgi:hypothetical protein